MSNAPNLRLPLYIMGSRLRFCEGIKERVNHVKSCRPSGIVIGSNILDTPNTEMWGIFGGINFLMSRKT